MCSLAAKKSERDERWAERWASGYIDIEFLICTDCVPLAAIPPIPLLYMVTWGVLTALPVDETDLPCACEVDAKSSDAPFAELATPSIDDDSTV